jgi:hypothetical protein
VNIQHRGVVYICRTEDDVRLVCDDIAEQEAQREAIARRRLHWDPIDEPLPGESKRRRVPIN